MSAIPSNPKEFFTQYLPARFEAFKSSAAGQSSSGSMVFRVGEFGDEFSIRLQQGLLEVSEGMADDVIVQVTVSEEDFVPLLVRGAELQEKEPPKMEAQIMAFKALTIDSERVKMVKAVKGSVAFVITDGAATRKLVITPGKEEPKVVDPDCKLECQMSDFLDIQTGKQLPIQLAMNGKMRIIGNAQIPMALNAVFG